MRMLPVIRTSPNPSDVAAKIGPTEVTDSDESCEPMARHRKPRDYRHIPEAVPGGQLVQHDLVLPGSILST